VHYVFFVFAVTELPAALVSPLQAAMAGLVVAAAGLRAAAALSRSRERGIAPAA
jgi:hypothetical protein